MNKVTDEAVKLLKELEGCALVPYQDIGETWTDGWGNTHDVIPGQPITQTKADLDLFRNIQETAEAVQKATHYLLNDNQFSAFVLFAFNLKNWRTSEQLERINSGDLAGAAAHWLEYDHVWVKGIKTESPGLLRRRKLELELFQS